MSSNVGPEVKRDHAPASSALASEIAVSMGAQPRPPRTLLRHWVVLVYPIVTVLVMIGLWQAVVLIFHVRSFLLPSPHQVWDEGFAHAGLLASSTGTTTLEIVAGFGLSIVVGIPLAVATVLWRPFDRVMHPLLVTSQTVPKVAIAPLLVVWVGLGTAPRIILAFVVAFFPVVIDTAVGLRSPSSDLIKMVRSMGATTGQEFRKVRFPHALPNIFSGLKVAIALAVVGAIVAELVGGQSGLGYVILEAQGAFDTALLFADIIVLSLLGIVLFYVVELAELIILGRQHRAPGDEAVAVGA